MKGRTLRKTEIVCAKAGNRVIVKQNLTPKNETMDIEKAITEGIVFKGGKSPNGKQEDKVKTKAKRKVI